MRILFVALTAPFPPTNGHRLRTWSMLQALAADGHELTLLVLAEDDEVVPEGGPLRRLCRSVDVVQVARPAGWRQYLSRAQALLSSLPYGVWRLRSPALQRLVRERLAEGSFDLLLCDGVYNMVNVPKRAGRPLVLNKDDVAHVILERYLRIETNAVRRVYGWLESRKVRRWERDACARATLLLASSRVDKLLLEALSPGPAVLVVPNTIDTDAYRPQRNHIYAPPSKRRAVVLYQGGMDWHPNRDAVAFFARHIWPELRRLRPETVFRVAGRSPSAAFKRQLGAIPGLEFTGTVPDMRTEIAGATVCVVPLRIGSGTRLKILEAAAMGKPIVSTSLGAEGLGLMDGTEILLADHPRQFARSVAELLGDERRRQALGRAARSRVATDNNFPMMRNALREAIEAMAP